MNTADKLLQLAEDRKKDVALSAEEAEELKKACQYIFSTSEGKIVASYMMKVCGTNKFPNLNLDPMTMACQRGMEYIYKFFVVGMVSPETKMEIETRGSK